MGLEDAVEHLTGAVRSMASSEQPLPDRVQSAWTEHVQMVWMQPCLTEDLLREFRDLWHRYTAPSADPRSTALRPLDDGELRDAIAEVVGLLQRTVATQAATADTARLATLADLDEP